MIRKNRAKAGIFFSRTLLAGDTMDRDILIANVAVSH
jgi:hypothetical protein